jgi:hypothetical protein
MIMAPTKDELEQENAELRERVAELESQTGALGASPAEVDGRGGVPDPQRPDFGLSAGEAHDLAAYGVTTSPFTGETLTASREGVEPQTAEARRNDERETKRLDEGNTKDRPTADAEER